MYFDIENIFCILLNMKESCMEEKLYDLYVANTNEFMDKNPREDFEKSEENFHFVSRQERRRLEREERKKNKKKSDMQKISELCDDSLNVCSDATKYEVDSQLYCSKNSIIGSSIFGGDNVYNLGVCYLPKLPSYVELRSSCDMCGYVSPDGEYFECGHCEHNNFSKIIVNEKFCQLYSVYDDYRYNEKPEGMEKEDFFLMFYMGFVKISSFKESIDKMYAFRYNTLTKKQCETIYRK